MARTPVSAESKTIQLGPLTGQLDTRSSPDDVAYGNYRWAQNVTVVAKDKARRRPGFERLYGELTTYNNQDLHNQLVPGRQPIQTLYEGVSTTGVRRIVACTQNRLYALNSSSGNWQILSKKYGGDATGFCSDRYWRVAQVEDVVVFSNGYNEPVYWTFDGPSDANDEAVSTIPDLSSVGVTRARVVASWKGVLVMANLTQDGVRIPYRVMWSDFRKPLAFVPGANSIAGYHDLGYGHDVLAILPLADSLLIYTARGIWEAQVSGDDTVFTFHERYTEPVTGNGCLAYDRAIVSTGSEHIYMGRDGLYIYDMYSPKPVRAEWLHQASAVVYDNIDDSSCGIHVAGWNPYWKEAWFSWTSKNDAARCPQRTLVINTQYQFCDIVPKGFTAFTNFSPTQGTSLGDWLLQNCACDGAGVDALITGSEAQYCHAPVRSVCETLLGSIYSTQPKTVYGVETEDYEKATPDGDSLFVKLGGLTLAQLCAETQSTLTCSAAQRFVMACSDDFCVKQYGGIYAYEICTGFDACPTYRLDGYESILRSGPIDFKMPHAVKVLRRLLFDYDTDLQTVPSNVQFRIGASRQPTDPNGDPCPIVWRSLTAKPLSCGTELSEHELLEAKLRPGRPMEWLVYAGGHYLYWELKVSGVGGNAGFCGLTMDLIFKATKYA